MDGLEPAVGNEYTLDVGYVTEMGDKVDTEGCKGISEGHRFKLVTSLGNEMYHDYSLISAEERGGGAPVVKLTSDVFGDVFRRPN